MKSILILVAVVLCLGSASVSAQSYCNTCLSVVQSTEDYLESGSGVQQAITWLDKLCAAFPPSEQKKCTNIINSYTDQVIQFVIQQLSPEQICFEIALCDNDTDVYSVLNNKYTQPIKPSKQAKMGSSDTYCQICTTLVQWYNTWADSNATVNVVTQELEKVCSILPKSNQQACVSFIAKYTPMIIEYAVEQDNPQEVCNTLGVCGDDTVIDYNKRS